MCFTWNGIIASAKLFHVEHSPSKSRAEVDGLLWSWIGVDGALPWPMPGHPVGALAEQGSGRRVGRRCDRRLTGQVCRRVPASYRQTGWWR